MGDGCLAWSGSGRRFHCAQGGSAVRWPICCRFPFGILSSWLSRDRQLTSLANSDRTSPYLRWFFDSCWQRAGRRDGLGTN